MVGIGNELNGDDAAGVVAIHMIQAAIQPSSDRLLINGSIAPENYTGKITKFDPDLVILIDAANMDEEPGTITLLPWDRTTGFSASTHTLPLYVMAEYLTTAVDCQVVVIGIQPQHINFAEPLSSYVKTAVKELTGEFVTLLSPV